MRGITRDEFTLLAADNREEFPSGMMEAAQSLVAAKRIALLDESDTLWRVQRRDAGREVLRIYKLLGKRGGDL